MPRTKARRRPAAPITTKRPPAHLYQANPALPGYCRRCELVKGNSVHSAEELAARAAELAEISDRTAAAQAEHQRRTGEAP